MSEVKIIIYQATFGEYDNLPNLIEELILHDGEVQYSFEHQIVTDKELTAHSELNNYSPILKNRYYKFNAVEIYPNYDVSVYLDGHISFDKELFYKYIISLYKSKKPFVVNKHRNGGSLFDELIRVIDNGKVSVSDLTKLGRLKIDFDLESAECGFIFRNHSFDGLIQQGKNWFIDFQHFPRDQLLLHKSFSSSNIKPYISDITFDKNIFKVGAHKNNKIKIIKYRILKAFKILIKGLLLD
ncbi:hypothetical protein N9E66_05095 [Gammaproteobacteria bacterium]|nr:hypothetical protein [Gammaproteobacteria bacterium]